MLTFTCSACGRRLRVNERQAGKRARCPHCSQVVPVPSAPAAVRPADSVLASPSLAAEPAAPPVSAPGTVAPGAETVTLPPPNEGAAAGAAGQETEAGITPAPFSSSGPPTEELQPGSSSPSRSGDYTFLAPPKGPGELGRLGPYQVLKVLGAGGMGIVFQARDLHLERLVALKAMLPALASDPSARQRFLREAKAAAAIEHDHIVTVHQVGEDRGVPFLAMPFLKGESLEDRLRRRRKLPPAEVLRVGREVAEGLAAAHDRGLIHRDIKPANIWLEARSGERGVSTPCARVKILDFGLARSVTDTAHLTQAGTVVGTPAYMAPEQPRGEAVDHRADLFSLGCVLYRMATGELPFKGADPLAILNALALHNPPPPAAVNDAVPGPLSDLIMQLLAKDPEDRPASAHTVVERIQVIERELKAKGAAPQRSDSPLGGGRHSAPKAPASDSASAALRLPSRRGIPPWLLVPVAALVALMALAGYLYGPAVYRIATNQGQLVIETDDPDVEVVVKQDGDRVRIIDPKGHHEVTLRAGAYQLELSPGKDGLALSTNQFTLLRGGREIVRVRAEPKAAAQPPPPAPSGQSRTPEGDTGPAPKDNRVRALDWLRENNRFGPEHRLVQDIREALEGQVGANEGFLLKVGAGLLKSQKAAVLAGWGGELFIFELTPDQARALNIPEMASGVLTIPPLGDVGREPGDVTLSALAINRADLLEEGSKVTGSVHFRRHGQVQGFLALRLMFVGQGNRVTLYQHLGDSLPPEEGTLSCSFPPLNESGGTRGGPKVALGELVRFVTPDRQGKQVVLSNPVAALVNVTVSPGQESK